MKRKSKNLYLICLACSNGDIFILIWYRFKQRSKYQEDNLCIHWEEVRSATLVLSCNRFYPVDSLPTGTESELQLLVEFNEPLQALQNAEVREIES